MKFLPLRAQNFFCATSDKNSRGEKDIIAKKINPRMYQNNYICVGMQSVNPSIKPFCSLLRETTQVWLLQLCLRTLTESGGIDGLRQFGALISHTLVEKRGVF